LGFGSASLRRRLLALLRARAAIESLVELVVQLNVGIVEGLVVLPFHHLGVNLLLKDALHSDTGVLDLGWMPKFGFVPGCLFDLSAVGLFVDDGVDVLVFRESGSALRNVRNIAHFFLGTSFEK
jgi:hypothetical protein